MTLPESTGKRRSHAKGLLTNLLVVEALPAWTSNRLERLVLSSKRHVVDGAVADDA